MPRLLHIASLAMLGCCSGCITPWNTRLPRFHSESAQLQRRESQLQDPFPNDLAGPEVGFRPLGFQVPRTEALQTRQHFRSTILKQQIGPPPGPQTGPAPSYPQAVRID